MRTLTLNLIVSAASCMLWLAAPGALADTAQQQFFERLTSQCGARFSGASVFPQDPADSFAGKLLVAHVASCKDDEIRIPFAVGEDRSRTWIVRREAGAITLKHDHRHADGKPDTLTMYGGPAGQGGSALSQSFSADAATAAMLPAAATNVWTITLSADGRRLTYALARDGKPRFKAELAQR